MDKDFLKMQKLAGLITESQYRKLVENEDEIEDELTLAYDNSPKVISWDALEKAYQKSGLTGEEFFGGYEDEFRNQFEDKPVSKKAYFDFYTNPNRADDGQEDRHAMANWLLFFNPNDPAAQYA